MEQAPTPTDQSEKSKSKERAFHMRLGAATLAVAILAAPVAANSARVKASTTKVETTDAGPGDASGTIYDINGNIIYAPDPSTSQAATPTITFAEPTATSVENPLVEAPNPPVVPLAPPGLSRPGGLMDLDPVADLAPAAPAINSAPIPLDVAKTAWEGKVLNAYDGRIDGPSGEETFYNLPMNEVVDRMHRMGVDGEYWVREDGVKMLGNYVIVAANLTTHPRGSIVETSLGTGIVCDTGSFAKKHPNRLDIATNW